MAADRLRIDQHDSDGALVLTVSGELDLATAPDLCLRLRRARADGRPMVVLDLGGVTFCDSSGLRALFGEAREAEIVGMRLAVVAPAGGAPRRLFELTGALEVLEVHEDAATAVEAGSLLSA